MTICPLCRKTPENHFFGLQSYYYCKNCSIAWQKNFSEPSYKEKYYKGSSGIVSILFFPIIRLFYLIRRGYVKNKNIGLWVDVGAGDGEFLRCVKAKQKIGVEISASGRKKMGEIGLKTQTDQEFLKVSGLNADVISFWHVLEHTQNPWMYLRSACRNLAKGGKIVIGVPNFDSFEFKLFKRYWFHLDPKHHFWHFSSKSIKKILENEEITIKKIDYWSFEHHLTGVLQSFINKTSDSANVLHHLLKRGEYHGSFRLKDAVWCVFWLTLGFPVVIGFWIAGSILGKSGAIIIIAEKKN